MAFYHMGDDSEIEDDGMGSIFNPLRNGTWYLHSQLDERWNASGTSFVGGFTMPHDCKVKLEELEKEYGESPNDLEWGYMKD